MPPNLIPKLVIIMTNTVTYMAGLVMVTIAILMNLDPAFLSWTLSTILGGLETAAKEANVTVDTSNVSAASVAFSIPFIVFGIVMGAVSFLGCISTCYECKAALVAYFLITLMLFLDQLLLFLIALINHDLYGYAVKPHLKSTITDSYSGMTGSDSTTLIWNGVMIQLQCCGVDNYADFNLTSKWSRGLNGRSGFTTPLACCKTITSDYTCAIVPTPANSNYLTGCYSKLWDYILSHSDGIIGIVVVMLASQLVLLFFTYIIIRFV